MHNLVPPFIIDNLRRDKVTGSFSCAALFVDISGFTRVTEALMAHGQYGAEVLAVVMRAVFTPLVSDVVEQGGFVTGFAGDAFTAVFPENNTQASPEKRALAAAWQMQQDMAQCARQETRFGTFDFSAKIGLANGDTTWGIVLAENGARATYYFSGPAIDDCALAEHHASAEEIVCGTLFWQAVQDHAAFTAIDDHWLIDQVQTSLPEPRAAAVPQPDLALLKRFAPDFLVEQDVAGEFRQILNLFVGLQGNPTRDELIAFMQHLFRLQDQFGGFLNRIDFGDKGCNLLLFWGAPLSQEQDLAHMLNFVQALERTSDIPIRAGITYRIAHAGFIGSAFAEEYTCYGRGVNLAARQMTGAGWGEIWLDGETARRARVDFQVEAIGSIEFKGFAEPQQVYRLRDRREKRLSRFENKPMVGRQQELDTLHRAVQPIFDGHFGGSITIIGEAGVGKSRLVDALYRPYLQQKQAAVFLCQADELLRQSLNPFRSFLGRYFNQSAVDSEAMNKQRFSIQFEELLASLSDSQLEKDLQRARSFLGNLVGLNWEGSLYEQLDPELRFENTLDGLKALFKAESLRRPVIIHMEDAHWWDQDSITFLTRLVRNVDNFPFVLLITSREALPESLFDSSVSQTTHYLQRLEQTAVTKLAESILGHPPSPALEKLLVERTEGNPFFVEQVLLYLQEHDLLESVESATEQSLKSDVTIPTDVRAVLTARLDRLPFETKDLVQKASVLGQEFDMPILSKMVGDDDLLESHLAKGEVEQVWFSSGRSNYVFRHALLRDAAYDMQLGARLRQLHQSAAAAYEQQYPEPARAPHYAEIAYHFDHAEVSEEARNYYGAAGSHAKEEYSNEDAVAYFGRALELAEMSDFDARYRYLIERETILQWLGDRERQEQDLGQLSELLADNPQADRQADLALRRSSFALVTGDYETAVARVKNALSHAQSAKDRVVEARIYHRWGRTLWQQGRSREARSLLEKAITLADGANNESLLADCFGDLAGVLRQEGHYSKAQYYLKRATEVYENLEDEQGIIRCFTLSGVVNADLGYFAESETNYLRALSLARETGWRFAQTYVLVNLGNTLFELGDFVKSATYLKQSQQLTEETGDLRTQANSLDTLGLIAHYSGQPDEALTNYERAIHIMRSINDKRGLGFVLTHAGYGAIDLGLMDQAGVYLDESLAIREELEAKALRMDTLAGAAQLALVTGQEKQALETASKIMAHIDEHGADGIELPILVLLICFKVLSQVGIQDPSLQEQASNALKAGNQLLEERLQRLPDENARKRFLRNVPYNQQMFSFWQAHQT